MEWLLIVITLFGKSPDIHGHGFKTKEECLYVGDWIRNDAMKKYKTRVRAKCFEVKL